MQAHPALVRSVDGYGLTTAQIFYRLPDRRLLIQEFIWQQFDLFPEFPALRQFLQFWEEKIEGPLHSVTVAHRQLIKPAEFDAKHGKVLLH